MSGSRVPLPPLAEVEITSACNARCVFCPRHIIGKPVSMDRSILKMVRYRLVEAGICNVKLVGFGEPTAHPDLIGILEFFRSAGLRPQLNTNGSLLHRYDMDTLLELCDEVIVSCPSLDPELYRHMTGGLDSRRFLDNFEFLLESNERYRRRITLYVVLTRINKHAYRDFAKFEDRVRLRLSGCSNRIVEGFASDLIDPELNRKVNAYPALGDGSSLCGYALASVVIDHGGRYLLCTNDMARLTGTRGVTNCSVAEVFESFVHGMDEGFYLEICGRCENTETYRRRLGTAENRVTDDRTKIHD